RPLRPRRPRPRARRASAGCALGVVGPGGARHLVLRPPGGIYRGDRVPVADLSRHRPRYALRARPAAAQARSRSRGPRAPPPARPRSPVRALHRLTRPPAIPSDPPARAPAGFASPARARYRSNQLTMRGISPLAIFVAAAADLVLTFLLSALLEVWVYTTTYI